MNPTGIFSDVYPLRTELSYSLFASIVVVACVILGVIFFVVLAILIGRRVTVTVKTGGVIALTLASILLLSGIWCIYLSPVSTRSETKLFFQENLLLETNARWFYPIWIDDGDTLSIRIERVQIWGPFLNDFIEIIVKESVPSIPINMEKAFDNELLESISEENVTLIDDGDTLAPLPVVSVYLFDTMNYSIWSEEYAYRAYHSAQLASGKYLVEIVNPHWEVEERCFVTFTVTGDVEYRPLEPFGQLMILVSLPIFGLGIWASGVLTLIQKRVRGD